MNDRDISKWIAPAVGWLVRPALWTNRSGVGRRCVWSVWRWFPYPFPTRMCDPSSPETSWCPCSWWWYLHRIKWIEMIEIVEWLAWFTVVNDDEFVGLVGAVRMRVDLVGYSVRGPTRVWNTHVRLVNDVEFQALLHYRSKITKKSVKKVKGLSLNGNYVRRFHLRGPWLCRVFWWGSCRQTGEYRCRFLNEKKCQKLSQSNELLMTFTSWIVSAILQTLQSFDERFDDFLPRLGSQVVQISEDS